MAYKVLKITLYSSCLFYRLNGLLPYPVIVAATHGDVDTINAVLKHYEGLVEIKILLTNWGNGFIIL